MISAVILAGGRSVRFGRPKALLPVAPSGPTFLERLVTTFRMAGIHAVLVVGRDDDVALREAAGGVGAVFVENPASDRGQLSSLICAIDAVGSGVDGVAVIPVDIPLVQPGTIRAVCEAFTRTGAPIARATCRGRHGHPVVFASTTFGELRSADPGVGARAVVRAHADQVLNVEVDDEGVLRDVDTVKDYRDLFGADP